LMVIYRCDVKNNVVAPGYLIYVDLLYVEIHRVCPVNEMEDML
jgi:hypothetical protein